MNGPQWTIRVTGALVTTGAKRRSRRVTGEACCVKIETMATNQPSTPDRAALRGEFPTLERWTYLDVARKTIPPRCQERAMQEYVRDVYENAGASAWAATNVAETRSVMARLLGARPA